jgi:hypothetical protein
MDNNLEKLFSESVVASFKVISVIFLKQTEETTLNVNHHIRNTGRVLNPGFVKYETLDRDIRRVVNADVIAEGRFSPAL